MPWSVQVRTTRASLRGDLAEAHAAEHPQVSSGGARQLGVAVVAAEAIVDGLLLGAPDDGAEFVVTLSGHAGAEAMIDGDHLTVTVARGPLDPNGLLT